MSILSKTMAWFSRSFSGKLDSSDRSEGGHQIEIAENVVIPLPGHDLARHPGDGRNSIAAFAHCSFRAAERSVAGIGVDILPGAVVCREEDQRIFVETECADLVHA